MKPPPQSEERPTILVVEDEVLISMELCDLLERQGYVVVGPAATVSAAIDLLGRHQLHACVLDVNLRGEHSAPVALLLRMNGVPFVLSSAYDSKTLAEYEAFRGVTNLGKPLSEQRLFSLLSSMLRLPVSPT